MRKPGLTKLEAAVFAAFALLGLYVGSRAWRLRSSSPPPAVGVPGPEPSPAAPTPPVDLSGPRAQRVPRGVPRLKLDKIAPERHSAAPPPPKER